MIGTFSVTSIKATIWLLVSTILNFFMPIQDFINAMLALFALNFIFGLLADIKNKKGWNKDKAGMFFIYCLIFFGITAFVLFIGKSMQQPQETTIAIKYLCWAAIYFFGTNILRNWKEITVEGSAFHRLVGFMYYVLSMQFVEKLPFLKAFLTDEKTNEENGNKQ